MQDSRDVAGYLQSCRTEFWQKVFRAELEYLARRLKGCRDILSVGCGPAIMEAGLNERGFRVTGLDVSEEALKMAPDGVRTVVGKAEEMDFPPAAFDAAIYVASLQFIERYEKALRRTAHALRPGGRLIAMLLNPASAFYREKAADPASYVSNIRHKDLEEIKRNVGRYFEFHTEYFLGIRGKDVFESGDPSAASLLVIVGSRPRSYRGRRGGRSCGRTRSI